jgi:thiamine biosynthesis protein ThiS
MQPELMEVVVNGERKTVPADVSIAGLLKTLEIPADRVAVELNKSIIRKRNWEDTRVPNGSQIEIVQFVGGG